MPETIQFYGKTKSLPAQFRKNLRQTINIIASNHGYTIQQISYIIMSDAELLEVNQTHLDHDDYTDIITFDLSDIEASIDGEIYVSIDRVKENADTYQTSFETELVRVMCHGILHLMGYKDKSAEDSKLMRDAEQKSITIYEDISQ